MVHPPNEELSALAQELLQAHRENHCPQGALEDRVWQRLHHSAFVAPAALIAEPLSQATGATSAKAGAAKGALLGSSSPATAGSVAATKAGLVASGGAGAAKVGLLGTVGAKLALVACVSGAVGVGAVVWQGERGEPREPSAAMPPTMSESPASPLSPPASMKAPSEQTNTQAPSAALELTPELQAQLSALSVIDKAIRKKAFVRARTRISEFYAAYSESPFEGDLSALKQILDCESTKARSKAKARPMLQDSSLRRYWTRIKRACGL